MQVLEDSEKAVISSFNQHSAAELKRRPGCVAAPVALNFQFITADNAVAESINTNSPPGADVTSF